MTNVCRRTASAKTGLNCCLVVRNSSEQCTFVSFYLKMNTSSIIYINYNFNRLQHFFTEEVVSLEPLGIIFRWKHLNLRQFMKLIKILTILLVLVTSQKERKGMVKGNEIEKIEKKL